MSSIPVRKEVRKILKNRCFYCGITINPPNYTRDHILPKSYLKKGCHKKYKKAYNLVPCCVECNQIKGDLVPRYIRPCYLLMLGRR